VSRVLIEVIRTHRDQRGYLFEPLGATDIARFRNVHVVLSVPGAVRGNHRHVRGAEITAVTGPALVRFKDADGLRDVTVPAGETWRFNFPPGTPHAFRNTGTEPMVLASFNTEEHDPDVPDAVKDEILPA
jgi:dTDP-4-dehydrorhamnose 3,5-epimerase-like enzyme